MIQSKAASQLLKKLFEVHYTDIFAGGFEGFHKKWKSNKGDRSLYVRFDSGDSMDSLARGASKATDHSDPVGTYAYPLKYVIDHPGDLWYGHNSKFLKVIRDKSRNSVRLDAMDEREASRLLRRAGLEYDQSLVKRYFPESTTGVTAPGKVFFLTVQHDFTNAVPGRKAGYKPIVEPQVRSSEAQRQLLLKMGLDALEDQSNTIKKAVINDREPEQIVWLLPTSYEILETFRLSDKGSRKSSVRLDLDGLTRKVAAKVAEVIGDRLSDSNKGYFWTKAERLIKVEVKDESLEWRMRNLKIGQKKHKANRKTDSHKISVELLSERGDFTALIFADDKIETGLLELGSRWSKASGDNGKRYSKERAEQAEREAKNLRFEQQRAEEVVKRERALAALTPRLNEVLALMGASKRVSIPAKEASYDTYEAMKGGYEVDGSDEQLFELLAPKADMDFVGAYVPIFKFVKEKIEFRRSMDPEVLLGWALRFLKEQQ